MTTGNMAALIGVLLLAMIGTLTLAKPQPVIDNAHGVSVPPKHTEKRSNVDRLRHLLAKYRRHIEAGDVGTEHQNEEIGILGNSDSNYDNQPRPGTAGDVESPKRGGAVDWEGMFADILHSRGISDLDTSIERGVDNEDVLDDVSENGVLPSRDHAQNAYPDIGDGMNREGMVADVRENDAVPSRDPNPTDNPGTDRDLGREGMVADVRRNDALPSRGHEQNSDPGTGRSVDWEAMFQDVLHSRDHKQTAGSQTERDIDWDAMFSDVLHSRGHKRIPAPRPGRGMDWEQMFDDVLHSRGENIRTRERDTNIKRGDTDLNPLLQSIHHVVKLLESELTQLEQTRGQHSNVE